MNEFEKAFDEIAAEMFQAESPCVEPYLQKYFDSFKELVDCATPKKPIEHHYEEDEEQPYIKYNCPNGCVKKQLHDYMKFCPYCGQAIDWSELTWKEEGEFMGSKENERV